MIGYLSALAAVDAVDSNPFSLSEHRLAGLAQINGAPANSELAAKLVEFEFTDIQDRMANSAQGLRLHWLGPNTWLAESEAIEPAELVSRLRELLADTHATVTDLGHARTRIQVSGPAALAVLAKGCTLDLERLPVGTSVPTQIEHLSIQLHRLTEDNWEIYVYRSFGLALWEWLERAGAEYLA